MEHVAPRENDEEVREHYQASQDHLPAWRMGTEILGGKRHASALAAIQSKRNLTPEQTYKMMDDGELEPGWVHRGTGDFIDRKGRALAKPQWGQAAVKFRGKVHTGAFHAHALDNLLAHYGFPRERDDGLEMALRAMPDLDDLGEENFGGIGKHGQFVGFKDGEWANRDTIPLKNLGGRVKR